jgi:ATP-dependent exoDNAse (exonuclease V) beta subunit
MNDTKTLKVFTASAGSGKTQSIANEYILNLFDDSISHRNILAITFTNKASEEMKERIITELYKLICGKNPELEQKINNEFNFSSNEIKEKAKLKFFELLHQYSFFSVQTIDSFLLKILKSFLYEISINFNFDIEFDTRSVISKAVDRIIDTATNDEKLKNIILRLVNKNIDDSKRWDFRNKLASFLELIFKDEFRKAQKEFEVFFGDEKNVQQLKDKIKHTIEDTHKFADSFYKEIEIILSKYNVVKEDFKGASRAPIVKFSKELQLIKVNSDSVSFDIYDKPIYDSLFWVKQSDSGNNSLIKAADEIKSLLNSKKDELFSKFKNFSEALTIQKNFDYIALVNYADRAVKDICNEENIFLICDVPAVISEIATNNSSSFIFEKAGVNFESYLLDEFQDTSRIQWESLAPLLKESLSKSRNKSIVVGDLKQAIYAWRNGDWKILAEDLPQKFNIFLHQVTLKENWRSGEQIITFNNEFFKKAAEISDNIINSIDNNQGNILQTKIYIDCEQEFPKHKNTNFKSIVSLKLFRTIKDKNKEKEKNPKPDFKPIIVSDLISKIEEIQEKKYPAGDIMILCRKNKEAFEIAQEIIKYGQSPEAKPGIVYDVISQDALFLNSNNSIKFIISCLNYLINSKEKLSQAEAAFYYYLEKNTNTDEIYFDFENFIQAIENIFEDLIKNSENLLLNELIEFIIIKAELNKKTENIPFINALRDLVHEYQKKNNSDLNNFLKFWEEKSDDLKIKVAEKQNAIKIITIHKAKGLASEFVLIPFCNWKFNENSGGKQTCWLQNENSIFNEVSIWPIDKNEKLKNTTFSKHYNQIKINEFTEAFNLLYVAFTRAKRGLFVYSADNENSVNNIITSALELMNDKFIIEIQQFDNYAIQTYTQGSYDENIAEQQINQYIEEYPLYLPNKKIRIKTFFESDKTDLLAYQNMQKGIVLHKILENTIKTQDLDFAIKKLYFKGIINKEQLKSYSDFLRSQLENEFIRNWFDGSYSVMTESEILIPGKSSKRPDRLMFSKDKTVIVDYKFGTHENTEYLIQMDNYYKICNELGFKNIETYIWYVSLETVIQYFPENKTIKRIELF